MRTIAVVTGTRADFGLYRPVLRELEKRDDVAVRLLACGAHLSADFGHTVDEIEAEGFPVAERIITLLASDTPEAVGLSMGLVVSGFAQSFARNRPDLLLVVGDRYEMFAAALAALPFAIPIAHIHGGELTEGAIDDALRHGLTKLSLLHFTATHDYRRRVIQLGENPERVITSGAPGLDNLNDIEFLERAALEERIGLALDEAPVLVTFHPETLAFEDTGHQIETLLGRLALIDAPLVITYPNADTRGRIVIEAIERFVAGRDNARAVKNLGTQAYFSLMRIARAMVGNSSSGIVEAASFRLPVVNLGDRQKGRVRARNVIDGPIEAEAVGRALDQALSPAFKEGLGALENPYGDGRAAERIVPMLAEFDLGRDRIKKAFHDLPGVGV